MHGRLYNEATIELALRPQTPLLIASGAVTGLDPSLPDIQFVRTGRLTEKGIAKEIYIPGSSFRGVLRSHAERLVRSVNENKACLVTEQNCLKRKKLNEAKLDASQAYRESCYICRLFGNTAIAARVKVSDFYPNGPLLTEVRHGVAIDRVTGAVAAGGPFQMETVTDGEFKGLISLRNFTLGQLGLLGAALLDIGDGFVPLGHAKSRGLGRVSLTVERLTLRFPQDPQGSVKGIGALVDEKIRNDYALPKPEEDTLPLELAVPVQRERGFFEFTLQGNTAKAWLEQVVSFWVKQLSP